jgi:uncharacterized membrane protein YhiD involved in acid resistance
MVVLLIIISAAAGVVLGYLLGLTRHIRERKDR